jgi:predicted nucleotidyltransferase component of viral defense system
VSARQLRNVAASVHRRLLNQARSTNRPFNELRQHYAMERLLYRLSRSKHSDRFVLKGALLLRVWEAPSVRPTMDIDLLGYTNNEPEPLAAIVREICHQPVEPDGLEFDAQSVTARTIVEHADYAGVRVRFGAQLGTGRITMQIDVGFGDVVTPKPTRVEYPTLLDFPPAKVLAYPREAAVAEKFQVMLRLAQLNSRLRDYYDVWLLSTSFNFDGPLLAEAIRKTCARRATEIPAEPPALSAEFAADTTKQTQWRAFRRKSTLDQAPEDLSHVVSAVAGFLSPIAKSLHDAREFTGTWHPPGPWKTQ